ncbi:MAG: sodium:solute symporter family protein [Acidobacteriota bacterium]
MSLYLWIILVYLLILTGFNFYRSKKIKSQDDFMVAGRKLSMNILVFTLICTWIGSGTFIAGAEYAAYAGWSSLWLPAGAWFGILIIYFLAGKIRTFGQYTIGDILEVRYGKLARLVGAIMIIIAFTTIVSYQFRAGGLILNILTGGQISVALGQFLAAFFVITFTFLGGMVAVAHTDLPNGIIILLACCIAVPLVVLFSGGVDSAAQNLPTTHMALFAKDFGEYPALKAGGYFLATLLLLMGIQSMYQKFYSARTPREARQATALWIFGTIIVEVVVVAIAIYSASSHWVEIKEFEIIRALQGEVRNRTVAMSEVQNRADAMIASLSSEGSLKPGQAIQLTEKIHADLQRVSTEEELFGKREGVDPAAIVLKAAEDISSYTILGFLAGVLLLGAACAVVISTGMNYLLSPTTNIMRDIYGRFIDEGASERKKIILQKAFVILVGVCAFLMIFIPTLMGSKISVLRYAYMAYTMYGVAITPALLAALAWKRATKAGGLSSIIGGGLTAFMLELVIPNLFPEVMKGGDPWGIPGIYISAAVSIGCLIIISLLTKAPSQEEIEELFPKISF